MLGQQPAIIEGESKKEDQVIMKDEIQGERLRETRSVDDNKVRKETKKRARADEPAIPISYPQRLKKGKLEKL